MEDIQQALPFALKYAGDRVDELSEGSVMLAFWLAAHGSWEDVAVRRDETSFLKVKKDSTAEIGKRMCVRGRVIQISRAGADLPVFEGNLMLPGFKVANFLSFGSTGELVEHSRARFCGFVTGRYAFSNVSGGQTQAVQLVGAFDLPENH